MFLFVASIWLAVGPAISACCATSVTNGMAVGSDDSAFTRGFTLGFES